MTAEQVRQAIDRGVAYLKNQQQADGSWNDQGPLMMHGGVSALCTLALLNCGVEPDDDAMQRGAGVASPPAFRQDLRGFAANDGLRPGRAREGSAAIRDNVAWLEKTQIRGGGRTGTTGPGRIPVRGGREGDNSNSQFALLALHEAERVGVSATM